MKGNGLESISASVGFKPSTTTKHKLTIKRIDRAGGMYKYSATCLCGWDSDGCLQAKSRKDVEKFIRVVYKLHFAKKKEQK